MKYKLILLIGLVLVSCNQKPATPVAPKVVWERPDESAELLQQQKHENQRMQFKLINSRVMDKNDLWAPFEEDLAGFSAEKYSRLKPMILESSIPELQGFIEEGKLSYEDLVTFYIYRIRKFESDNDKSLNAVIALNPDVIDQARALDARSVKVQRNSLYGMPVLLKDNIDLEGMPTTAGAIAFENNFPQDNAFIVDRLLKHHALILGKANLSEWAYFFCEGCPLGYSAVGGQTLNPYGRKVFESGGSSSGSGAAIAANYAVAAVGTETSGSILSPSSKNALVGLKPTVGLLSRSGIVPISGSLDTPGPMARSVIDAAILLDAMTGKDPSDSTSVEAEPSYVDLLKEGGLKGKRVGVMVPLLQDSLYRAAVEVIEQQGAEVIPFTPEEIELEGFSRLLTAEMKRDLPLYIAQNSKDNLPFTSVADIVEFNNQDSLLRAPYGQQLLEDIVVDSTSAAVLDSIVTELEKKGQSFFETPMASHQLDAVLSINNYHAGYAAVAKYPALTVPMGYTASGEPVNVTFIARPYQEDLLLQIGRDFEQVTKLRRAPEQYQ